MKKTLKYLLVLLVGITICLSFNYCYAVDLNLTENSTSSNSATSNSNSSTYSNSATNSVSKANTTSTSTTVSSVSSIPESNLGLSNILSILLATVGVIIIFLGIAILIKLNR